MESRHSSAMSKDMALQSRLIQVQCHHQVSTRQSICAARDRLSAACLQRLLRPCAGHCTWLCEQQLAAGAKLLASVRAGCRLGRRSGQVDGKGWTDIDKTTAITIEPATAILWLLSFGPLLHCVQATSNQPLTVDRRCGPLSSTAS